jgi:hypothetical protein
VRGCNQSGPLTLTLSPEKLTGSVYSCVDGLSTVNFSGERGRTNSPVGGACIERPVLASEARFLSPLPREIDGLGLS